MIFNYRVKMFWSSSTKFASIVDSRGKKNSAKRTGADPFGSTKNFNPVLWYFVLSSNSNHLSYLYLSNLSYDYYIEIGKAWLKACDLEQYLILISLNKDDDEMKIDAFFDSSLNVLMK